MSDPQPQLEYLLACSEGAIESYVLSRLNRRSNLHRGISDLIDDWLCACQDERFGRWLAELRRRSVKHLATATFVRSTPCVAPVRAGSVPLLPSSNRQRAPIDHIASQLPQLLGSSSESMTRNLAGLRTERLAGTGPHQALPCSPPLLSARRRISSLLVRTSVPSTEKIVRQIDFRPVSPAAFYPESAMPAAEYRERTPLDEKACSPLGGDKCTAEKRVLPFTVDGRRDASVSRRKRSRPNKPGPIRAFAPGQRVLRSRSLAS